MHTTPTTSAPHLADQTDTDVPRRPRSRQATAAIAVAGMATAAGVVAMTTTPVMAFVSANHNETMIRSERPNRRAAAAALVTGATIAAGAVAISTTPVLAFIAANHNETVVRSPGRS